MKLWPPPLLSHISRHPFSPFRPSLIPHLPFHLFQLWSRWERCKLLPSGVQDRDPAANHRRQFPPGPWWLRTRPLLRHGQVQTLVDLTKLGKVKKSVTDGSSTSPDMLGVAFHFSPLSLKWESNIGHCNLNSCDFESISSSFCHTKKQS